MEKIKETRERKGIARKELAKAIGVTDDYLYRVESGRAGLTVKRLKEIAKVLDVKASELIEE